VSPSASSVLDDVDHVVWDWNGTLLDDHDHCVRVMNHMLVSKGLPETDLHSYRKHFDFPAKRYYERLGFDVGPAEWEALARFFIETYDGGVDACALQPQAADVLTRLHAQGKTSSILTAARGATLGPLLERHGIRHFFTEIVGLDDHYAHGKLELGVAWIRRSAVDPRRTLLVGDTVHDFEVASAMGIRCVLVAAGHHARERLEACGCPVLDELGDLGRAQPAA
jgi:phosphoglycolate phosphatase